MMSLVNVVKNDGGYGRFICGVEKSVLVAKFKVEIDSVTAWNPIEFYVEV